MKLQAVQIMNKKIFLLYFFSFIFFSINVNAQGQYASEVDIKSRLLFGCNETTYRNYRPIRPDSC